MILALYALLFCGLQFMQCHQNIINNKRQSRDTQNVTFMMGGYDSLTNKIWIILKFPMDYRIQYNYQNIHIFEYIFIKKYESDNFKEHQWPFKDASYRKIHTVQGYSAAIIDVGYEYNKYYRKAYPYLSLNGSIYYEHEFWRGSHLKSISMRSHQMTIVKDINYGQSPQRPTCFTKSINEQYLYFFPRPDICVTIFDIKSTQFIIKSTQWGQRCLPWYPDDIRIRSCLVASDNYLYVVDTKNELFRINAIDNNNFNNYKWNYVATLNHKYIDSYVTELNGYIYSIGGFACNESEAKYIRNCHSYYRSNSIEYLPLKSLTPNKTNNVTFFEAKLDIIPFIIGVTTNDCIYLFGKKEVGKLGGCCFDLVQRISFEREKEEKNLSKKNIYHPIYIIDNDEVMNEFELQTYGLIASWIIFVVICVFGYGYKKYKHSLKNHKSI